MHYYYLLLILLLPLVVKAQTDGLGSWSIINIKYNINSKWSSFGEVQLRSLSFYDNFHYYEYKGGLNYKVQNNLNVSFGAGSYQTYKEGGNFGTPKNNSEFRFWPQMLLFQTIGIIKIEQRYRVELRYTTDGYRSRYRYRVEASYSLGAEKDNYKPFQISIGNELFFTDKEPYFERNRAYIGIHYKPSKTFTVLLGYLHQFDYKINDEIGRDFLQLGFFQELFRKKHVP